MFCVVIYVVAAIFIAPALALVGVDETPLSDEIGYLSCFPVTVADSTKIDLRVTGIEMNDTDTPVPDIPYFLFTLKDFDKFDNMIGKTVLRGYRYRGLDSGEITVKEEYANDDTPVFTKDVLKTSSWGKDTTLVSTTIRANANEEPGYQCFHISYPEEVKGMTIDILVMNKHGYLLYPDYVKYEQGIYFTAIGLAILLVYFYSIYSHSKSSDGFNSISSLSKRFTFGIYLPYMLISVVRLVYYYIQNSNPSTAKAQYSNGTRVHRDSSASFLDLCEEFFHYANYHLLMLVAMGYGSIYCSNSTANKKSNGTRVLPSRLWNFALKLILVTIFVITVKHFDDKYSENLFDFLDYLSGALEVTNKHINAYYFISPVIQFVETILPLTWVSISTIYFSRTYSKIDKMKLSGKSLQGRVARSFKYSIVLIAVIPVVFGAVYMTFIVWQVSKTGREFRSNQRPSFEAYEAAILDELIMRQKMVFSRNFQIQKLWLENLYILISMVVTYFLWIKDNTGLIGDNTLYEKIPMSTSRSKSREETVYENNSE